MQKFLDAFVSLWNDSGLARLFNFEGGGWKNLIMIGVACVLLFLAIKKQFEPLLLLPIAFGMLLVNLPLGGIMDPQRNSLEAFTTEQLVQYVDGTYEEVYPVAEEKVEYTAEMMTQKGYKVETITNANGQEVQVMYIGENVYKVADVAENGTVTVIDPKWQHFEQGGLLWYLYQGVKFGIYPPLIFLGIGCMTDFGPLLSNPKSFLLGAAAQLGIFFTFFGARALGLLPFAADWGINFSEAQAASIGIIGGADGPTAIFLTSKLAPELLGAIAVAAYSYMALVPIIQPPVIKACTTKAERRIKMTYKGKPVAKSTKILFPIVVMVIVGLVAPDAVALIGFLMFGNLIRECGVLDSLSETAQKVLANLITILLGISIAARMTADEFLQFETLLIMALGLVAFIVDTFGGIMIAKLMNLVSKEKINPMIGAAGISAFPMSARVVHKMGLEEDNSNFLLMHSIGVNVSGQIASVIAGGLILALVRNMIGG